MTGWSESSGIVVAECSNSGSGSRGGGLEYAGVQLRGEVEAIERVGRLDRRGVGWMSNPQQSRVYAREGEIIYKQRARGSVG